VTVAISTKEWTHIRGSSRTRFDGAVPLAAAGRRFEDAVNTNDMPTRAVVSGGAGIAAYAYGILCLIVAARRLEHWLADAGLVGHGLRPGDGHLEPVADRDRGADRRVQCGG